MADNMPKRTQEEIDKDMEEWAQHPLNCSELTPEMLEKPEFQALMNLAHEGEPIEVATNFKNHAYEGLSKLLMRQAKNEEKEF